KRTLTVSVGAAFDLPITLEPAAQKESVTVAADATVIDTSRTQVASTVDQSEVRTLPLLGRNFLDIALLVPGVSRTNVGGGTRLRDRTFFFANLERKAVDQSGLVTISDASVTAINTRLAAVGYGGPPVVTGIYANPVGTTHFLAKVDQHFAGGSSLSLRYS